MRKMKTLLAASALASLGLSGLPASAAEEGVELLHKNWPHEGIFGTFDRASAQRGFQIYREVCSSCHGLRFVAFRNLEDLGFSEEEVKALAEEYEITDGPNDEGDMFERPGKPSDMLPSPYPNDAAARVANGGALPPDLSLITKSRADGSDYLYSLMLGYHEEPPEGVEVGEGMYYNEYFPGHQIAMPQPLYDGQVVYADETPATLEQLATDVTTFLTWAAEPKLEERKQAGLKVMLFLIILTALLYATKRKVWSDLH
jgi:cytochrome c1